MNDDKIHERDRGVVLLLVGNYPGIRAAEISAKTEFSIDYVRSILRWLVWNDLIMWAWDGGKVWYLRGKK